MKFVAAIDGSAESREALDFAVELATAVGADLTVVHAVDPDVYDEGGTEPIADFSDAEGRLVVESLEDAEERALDLLEGASVHAEDCGVDATTELLYGDPVEAVADFARVEGADDVFVGHRGLSEEYERVLGSVAKGLIERASVPVTVVR